MSEDKRDAEEEDAIWKAAERYGQVEDVHLWPGTVTLGGKSIPGVTGVTLRIVLSPFDLPCPPPPRAPA